MKKIALTGTLLLFALVLSGCGNKPNNPKPQPQSNAKPAPVTDNSSAEAVPTINQGDYVLFWGDGCPHCVNVEKFLEENPSLQGKLNLKKIEVFNNINGQKVFLEKIKECGLSNGGVPTLYKDGKCTQGDQPIIDEFKKNL